MQIPKLNQAFRINPLYEADGYKPGHAEMLAPNTTKEYWHWIPRNLKYMPKGIEEIMSAGQQLTWRYIHSVFQENFFFVAERKVCINQGQLNHLKTKALKFIKDISFYLGIEYSFQGFSKLWDLGYLPVKIKALPEGVFTKKNIPHMTGINTVDGYAWLGLFLETLISKLSWQCPTTATIGFEFKLNVVKYVTETDPENIALADFMCHDFHSRGGNPYTSIAAGFGHAFSNLGSDSLNVIPASRYYYDFDENKVPIFSVLASEHSVTCTGIFYYERLLRNGKLNHEIKWYYSFSDLPSDGSIENPDYLAIAECLNLRDWLKKWQKGILSVVSDTMNLWKLITHVLPRLKDLIISRDGKLVIRPDSGDPVDITCGELFHPIVEDGNPRRKGVIELLWDIFGGEITSTGYKRLDSHIGAIYGDSITLDRQIQIYERLKAKNFAATNIVLGIGSYTYVFLTRDAAGWAIKGAWFQVKEWVSPCEDGQCKECEAIGQDIDICRDGCVASTLETTSFNIYKDPITDNGTKKSLKGFCAVFDETGEGDYFAQTECTPEMEETGELQIIYEDGEFFNQTTIDEIRERTKNQIAKRLNA